MDTLAGFGDGLNGGEVGGSCVDGGIDEIEEVNARLDVTSGNAGFDEHLQLPVAGAVLVVITRTFEGGAEFAEAAIGAEAQVDAIAHTFGRVGREQFRVLIGELLEKLLVGHAGIGLAISGVKKHQVDIGTVVEFAAAKFAEGDHGEECWTRGGVRRAVLRRVLENVAIGGIEDRIGRLESSAVMSASRASPRTRRGTMRRSWRRRRCGEFEGRASLLELLELLCG